MEPERLLTDKTGDSRAASALADMAPTELTVELHATAARELHPRDVDVVVPHMVLGRAGMLADSAFVTIKASAETSLLAHSNALVDHGVVLGRRSVEQRDGGVSPKSGVCDVAERLSGIAQPERGA